MGATLGVAPMGAPLTLRKLSLWGTSGLLRMDVQQWVGERVACFDELVMWANQGMVIQCSSCQHVCALHRTVVSLSTYVHYNLRIVSHSTRGVETGTWSGMCLQSRYHPPVWRHRNDYCVKGPHQPVGWYKGLISVSSVCKSTSGVLVFCVSVGW